MHLIVVERDPLAQGWWRNLTRTSCFTLSFADDLFVAAAIVRSDPEGDAGSSVVADAEAVAEAGQPAWRRLRRLLERRGVGLHVYSSSTRFFALAQLLGREADGFICRPFGLNELIRATRPRPEVSKKAHALFSRPAARLSSASA